MTKEEIFQLKNRLSPFILKESTPQYTYYQIKTKECSITAYTSGKVVFQGADLSWLEPKPTHSEAQDEAGSDEVGTGDYFGPIVVTASYVDIKDKFKVEELGVRDSKKLNDDKIMKVAPKLIKEIPHVTFILTDKEYKKLKKIYIAGIKKIK